MQSNSTPESPGICCFNDALVKAMAPGYFRPLHWILADAYQFICKEIYSTELKWNSALDREKWIAGANKHEMKIY